MAVNIPIRLVRADGDLIALDVTNLTLDVDRNINPHGLPFSGAARFAFDLNMPKAVILLEGFMVDAPPTVDTATGTNAYAVIDFSSIGRKDIHDKPWIEYYTVVKKAVYLDADELREDFKMTLKSTNQTNYDIYFTKSNSASGNTNGKYWISVVDASGNTRGWAEIALNLYNLINLNTGNTVLGAVFSAAQHDSTITGEDLAVVAINQLVKGEAGNNSSPQFSAGDSPFNIKFDNGKNSDAQQGFSAGDKVMQLFGILSNSIDRDFFDVGDNVINVGGYADYISGIQIPFNSTVGADGEKYVAKNFFMPTGINMTPSKKTPDKAFLASSKIKNPDNEHDFSFIKGTITKATFVQIAGEPIYQFNIQFLPIDNII